MIKLFEDIVRNSYEPQGHNEDSYAYYNQSARYEIIESRLQIEEWFKAYPDTEKNDLRNTFKNDFNAGFFELFLFTLFYKMGYNINIHPTVQDSNKTPDFLVSGFGQEFYLEAKVSYYESEVERATAKRLGTLYEVLDKAQILDFFIYLRTIKEKRKMQPRANDIRRVIEEAISRYNVEELYDAMNSGIITSPPLHVYEDDDLYLEFGPIPKSIEGRGKAAQRAIGIYAEEAKVLENASSLRKALKMKAGRYSALNKPYLIAINAIDMIALDNDDIWDCLMGTTCVVPPSIENGAELQEFRQHNGFFTGRNDQGQNTRVSAAFITKINPNNWRAAEYWIIEHQKARHPISLRTSPLITRFVKDNIIYRTKGMSFGEIIQ